MDYHMLLRHVLWCQQSDPFGDALQASRPRGEWLQRWRCTPSQEGSAWPHVSFLICFMHSSCNQVPVPHRYSLVTRRCTIFSSTRSQLSRHSLRTPHAHQCSRQCSKRCIYVHILRSQGLAEVFLDQWSHKQDKEQWLCSTVWETADIYSSKPQSRRYEAPHQF